VPIVEANTARCLARLTNLQIRIDSGEGQAQLWERAASIVPKSSAGTYNSALTDLGAMICIPGQPRCGVCPVRAFCLAENPATLPLKKTRTPLVRLIENHLFATRAGKVLLEQSSVRWRGMWILPRIVCGQNDERPVHTAQFPFTHHQITLQVFAADAPMLAADSQRYFTLEEIDRIPVRRRIAERSRTCSPSSI
jgi:A/G-specific adenine glycosylase